jgi:hypothetical protein
MPSTFVFSFSFAVAIAGAGCLAGSRPAAPGTGGSRTGGAAGSGGQGGATRVDAAVDATTPTPGPFDEQVLAIAAQYASWGRVDDELRWAPFLCRQPLPGITRPSESDDGTTHGKKLYSVFAKNHAAYPNGPHDGQVVVKESWIPEAVPTPDGGFQPTAAVDAGDHFYPYARGDGGVFRAAAPAGLFIMFKVDAATAETDLGWVYATVSTSGQVTSAGRVASCMGCHEVAEHERLFGVPLSPGLP